MLIIKVIFLVIFVIFFLIVDKTLLRDRDIV